jgi:hypothetical protein
MKRQSILGSLFAATAPPAVAIGIAGAAAAAILALGQIAGCGNPTDELAAERAAALRACQLDDGTVEPDADVRACDPTDIKKTTVCHIPPGNPANAHTICIGNPAVSHHIKNHGDSIGACVSEKPCLPHGGMGGAPEVTGTGGAPEVAGTGGMPEAAGTGGATIIP